MTHESAAMLGDFVVYEIEAFAGDGRRIDVAFTVVRNDGKGVSQGRHSRVRVNARDFIQRLGAKKDDDTGC